MSDKQIINNWKKWCPKNIHRDISIDQNKENENKNTVLYKIYYDEGFKAGIKEGYKLKLKRTEFDIYCAKLKIQKKMKDCLEILHESFKHFDVIIVDCLLQIVLKISSKIINNSLNIQKSKIIKKIQLMLSTTILSKKIIFKININDKYIFEEYFKKILSSYNYIIQCDPHIKSGECIIDLERETLDSTSFTKWKELCRLFCHRQSL
ncbi:Flagellar assembly protein FliH [Buchnera aphidicola (Takecallis arundicolens)]|uniref:FliH/SctL family protein n=1 Tax=Buchnera aphidicola TaxID=9 RepID=UPI003464118F